MNDVKKYYLYRALMKRFSLPIMVFHMAKVGITPEQIGLIGAMGYGAQMILEFPSGVLSDKIGYKKTLVIAGILSTLGLTLFLGNSFWWFLASAVLYWTGSAFRSGADSSLFYERLLFLGKEAQYRSILGNIRTLSGLAALSFALLSGIVYEIHWSVPFILTAMLSTVASVLILMIGETNRTVNSEVSLRGNMFDSIKYIRQNFELLLLISYQAIVFGLVLTINEFNGSLLSDVGIVTGLVGVIYALRHLTMSISGQIAKHIGRVLDERATYSFIAISCGILFVGYGLFDGGLATTIILILVAVPQTLLNVSYSDHIERISASKYRASIQSASTSASSLVLFCSLLVVGFMTNFFQLRSVVLVVGLLIAAIGTFLSFLLGRRVNS